MQFLDISKCSKGENRPVTTEERLERLEKELIGKKRISCWLLTGLCVVTAAWVAIWAPRLETAAAQSVVADANVVRAYRFILEDANGNHRAILAMSKDGPRLFLLSESGKPRFVLGVSEELGALAMFDEKGNLRAKIYLDKTGPKLGMYDEMGKCLWKGP